MNDEPVAGNGLLGPGARALSRRRLLTAGAGTGAALVAAQAAGVTRDPWMLTPGAGMSEAGTPSRFEDHVKRIGIGSQPGTIGSGASKTPLEHLEGVITPSRLHFERHHSGIPDIDPAAHQLVIHGMVERPLAFSLETLARYPVTSCIQFLECSGNSGALTAPQPVQSGCGGLHGLISNSEWGGVPLSTLLDEAGVKRGARWVVASGGDAAAMGRSVPLAKCLDDAIVALWQNGERLRPANGYPMRLFLPGWEGNMSVKWLRTLKVVDQPAMTKDETSKYSDLQADGEAHGFTFPMGVKSVITSPSGGLSMEAKGLYQISGIAWSGAGRIRQVEVSADGGRSWAPAKLDGPALDKSVVRFRSAWQWNGGPATLLSRATDASGAVQPTRAAALTGRAPGAFYHYNGIQAWRVNADGAVENTYV